MRIGRESPIRIFWRYLLPETTPTVARCEVVPVATPRAAPASRCRAFVDGREKDRVTRSWINLAIQVTNHP